LNNILCAHNIFKIYIDFVRCQFYNTIICFCKLEKWCLKYLCKQRKYSVKIIGTMAKETKKQQEKIEKVMHEYKEGTLKSGKDGAGGKVKSHKQAIAIAMSEAGMSKNKK